MKPFASNDEPGSAERDVVKPALVLAFTAFAISTYIAVVGPVAFYYESYGTLMLSPIIYVRILPPPLNEHLLYALAQNPTGSWLLCWVPILLLVLAASFAINALRKRSLRAAWLCFGMCAVVFGTYHFLRPMGITYVVE